MRLLYDEDIESIAKEGSMDDIQGLGNPMTSERSKKAKETLENLIATLLETSHGLEELKPKLVNCLIQIEEIKEWCLHLSVIKILLLVLLIVENQILKILLFLLVLGLSKR